MLRMRRPTFSFTGRRAVSTFTSPPVGADGGVHLPSTARDMVLKDRDHSSRGWMTTVLATRRPCPKRLVPLVGRVYPHTVTNRTAVVGGWVSCASRSSVTATSSKSSGL